MTLAFRISLAACLLAAFATIAIGGVSFVASRDQILANTERALKNRVNIASSEISGRLGSILTVFKNLARNTVVFNALIDSSGRETYLLPFFEGFTTIENIPVQISLMDFQGQMVATTGTTLTTKEEILWLRSAIKSGKSTSAIFKETNGSFLILAEMLLYPRTRTVEGVLLLRFPVNTLMPHFGSQENTDYKTKLGYKIWGQEGVFNEAKQIFGSLSEHKNLDQIEFPHWTHARKTLLTDSLLAPLHLTIDVYENGDITAKTLNGLIRQYVIIGAVTIALILLMGLMIGRRITAPLRRLEEVASSITVGGALDHRFEGTASTDINRVGDAFNLMLDRLSAAYQQLQTSAFRLSTLLKSLPEEVVIITADASSIGTFDDISGNLSLTPFQKTPEKLLQSIPDLSVILRVNQTILKSHVIQEIEYQTGRTHKGVTQWFEARVTELPEEFSDNTPAMMWVIHNISDRKSAEEGMRRAQRMEAVGQLTGGVAHDFNNLLAVIHGNAEMLANSDDKTRKRRAAIMRASQRGAELTQRLLAFSRKQSLSPQSLDMNELVETMSELLSRTLGMTIEIRIGTSGDIWNVHADRGQLENALLNLAINARDAMPDGGKLEIKCQNTALHDTASTLSGKSTLKDYVVIAVSDTGTGMPLDVQARAFEPFFTTKGVGEGSGLGLSMVYGFIQQSGGHVTIDSEVGKGTTVNLYLPRARTHPSTNAPASDTNPEPGNGELILVLEDDPEVLLMVKNMLEDLGYRCLDAATTDEAEEALRNEKSISLILSDVILPGGTSGPQFANKHRSLYPDLKVVFMSGYTDATLVSKELFDENTVLLTKPFQKIELAETIRRVLDN
jgi:signal transduction histidine kinase/HAMP domain-containing protein